MPTHSTPNSSLPLPLQLPLRGSQLIEASAGTGKTWTIAVLYLRLILGHGCTNHTDQSAVFNNTDKIASPVSSSACAMQQSGRAFSRALLPSEILVLTFTRAASQELVDRIRARLSEAARFFRASEDASNEAKDDVLYQLRAGYAVGTERESAAWRLANAAEMMDDSAIHTIDAWCQRILLNYASLTGATEQESLDPDAGHLQRLAAMDYWRQHVYPLHDQDLQELQSVWPNADAWLSNSMELMHAFVKLFSSTNRANLTGLASTNKQNQSANLIGSSLQQLISTTKIDIQRRLSALAQGWVEKSSNLLIWLESQIDTSNAVKQGWDGRKFKANHIRNWITNLQLWAASPKTNLNLSESAQNRLSPAGLQDARKQGAPEFFIPQEILDLQVLIKAIANLPNLTDLIKQHAGFHAANLWQQLKLRNNVFDFNDLLKRVQQALSGSQATVLRERLLTQYPAALIDEFQDTSPGQYWIFNQLYQPHCNHQENALLLIGDPKQSIYAFRGADIHSYLKAKHDTTGRHWELNTNFRSSPNLIEAIEKIFRPAEAFSPHSGAFLFCDQNGHNPLPFSKIEAHGLQQRLIYKNTHPAPALTVCSQHQAQSSTQGNAFFAKECAEQVVRWLQTEPLFFQPVDQPNENTNITAIGNAKPLNMQPLQPSDIAILVNNRQQAQLVRSELQKRNLASVYLSEQESVFSSAEAKDLVPWLSAVANPTDIALARAAFASQFINASLPQLCTTFEDDQQLEKQLDLLKSLHEIWRVSGVLPMLRRTMHVLKLPTQWLHNHAQGARRLTNFLHLAELLQRASTQQESLQGLVRWLIQNINDMDSGIGSIDSDEKMVRLESDAALIKVITIHKSKGLEYPLVMLPFASHFYPYNKKHDQTSIAQDAIGIQKHNAPRTDLTRLQEDLRLFYVALTRARHALWLGLAVNKQGNNKINSVHLSAFGYLLRYQQRDAQAKLENLNEEINQPLNDDAWWQLLDKLKHSSPNISLYETTTTEPEEIVVWHNTTAKSHFAPNSFYPAGINKNYAIASFSSLTKGISHSYHHSSKNSPMQINEAELSAWQAFLWQLPQKRADDEPTITLLQGATFESDWQNQQAPWHLLPAGTRLGNCMHAQLEWLQRDGFTTPLTWQQSERLQRNFQQAGFLNYANPLQTWLEAILQTPLHALCEKNQDQSAPCLQQLANSLSETEFWLPNRLVNSTDLDRLCNAAYWPELPRQSLVKHQWHGLLSGFIDLIIEFQGRYWVLDYKTNRLGEDCASYEPEQLRNAILTNRYDLQALLYQLVLHRLLQNRLPNYDPKQHLGGALFWFVRGIDAKQNGLIALPAPLICLPDLEIIFAPNSPPYAVETL